MVEEKEFMSNFSEISHDELKREMDAGHVALLDCNGTEHFAQEHIPGSIDFATNEGHLLSLLPADRNALIVSYCGGPQCNAWEKGANEVARLGFSNVKHFAPGIAGWIKAGERTETAHPVMG
jgi:rhodanese-related sulfurtransferase